MFALATLFSVAVGAQTLNIKGVGHNNRYDDGEQMKTTWIGSLYDENGNYTGTTAFIVDQGIYVMNYDGQALGTPEKSPAVVLSEIKQGSQVDYDKAVWATNFNLMHGNSGAVYVDGQIVTVHSRDEQSTVDEELFRVCKWDAKTGNLLSNELFPKSACIESAGMSYNPVDGKVYGLFYLTGSQLPTEITEDPDYFVDEDEDLTDGDAGYCLCTIDLGTMTVTPITPGLYYENFITFAINSEGRAFALTSGGSSAPVGEDGKQRNIDNELVGAQLYEFDLKSGLKIQNAVYMTDEETGEDYIEYESVYPATGYSSQYSRQAACFAKSNPNKMYWIGYYNSGKGYNSWGSWGTLPDRDKTTGETWRDNGKYDTAIYEIDVTTGEATRISKVTNRWIFSALWIDGDDCSDGAGIDVTADGVAEIAADAHNSANGYYNMSGQNVGAAPAKSGLYITRVNGKMQKVVIK